MFTPPLNHREEWKEIMKASGVEWPGDEPTADDSRGAKSWYVVSRGFTIGIFKRWCVSFHALLDRREDTDRAYRSLVERALEGIEPSEAQWQAFDTYSSAVQCYLELREGKELKMCSII
jgi:hypothetical protein